MLTCDKNVTMMEEEEISLESTMEDEEMNDSEEVMQGVLEDFMEGDGKIKDDEEITITEPSSVRKSDNSEPDFVAKGIEEYLGKEESGSEFSFGSLGTLDEDVEMVDGFVDLSTPFDMELLRSCIEHGRPVLEKVQGEDVVIVLGKTGVGKSLFIQGIAGKKIVPVKYETEYDGATAFADAFEAKDPVPGFDIGHTKVSKTKSINCFVRKSVGRSSKDIVYVDCPGFEDSAGPEVDIATSVMLSQVAKKARSLRFVVLINFASLIEDRGGAMRAVLKLAQAFVSDFETDKRSFMFLFTHINNNAGDIPESLDDAKARLGREIFFILAGTNDPDVQKVLEFMRISLEKKYKFVDILHPILSDFKLISWFAENRLSTIKHPALVTNCGLTIKAQMRLIGQLQHMLLTLRKVFSTKMTCREDMQELKRIRETFQYFQLYIGIAKVQESVNECTTLFDAHLTGQRDIFERELQKATDKSTHFSSGNVTALKAAAEQLVAFSGEGNKEYNEKRVHQIFYAAHAQVMKQDSVTALEETLYNLERMKAWSSGFKSFVTAFEEACHFVEKHINILSVASMETKSISNDISMEELVAQVQTLVDLQQVNMMTSRLSAHGIDMSGCSHALELFKTRLSSLATKWGVPVAAELSQKDTLWDTMPARLQLAIDRAKKLECVSKILNKEQSISVLIQAFTRATAEILSFVTEGIQCLCDQLSSELKMLPQSMQDRFGMLASIVSSAEESPGRRWATVGQPYKELLVTLKTELTASARAIEMSARQFETVSFRDGFKEAQRLLAFKECVWIDSFVETGFVQQESDRLHMIYISKMEVVVDKALYLSSMLSVAAEGNVAILKECHQSISEIKEYEAFEAVIVGPQGMAPQKQVLNRLRVYRVELTDKAKRSSERWYSSLKGKHFDDTSVLTETLDALLGEIEAIESFNCMPKFVELTAPAKVGILNTFKAARDFVEEEFSKPANYKAKADCLACIAKIRGHPRTDAELPKFYIYKETVRTQVSKDALAVEKMLEECVDGNKIDTCLNDFERATVLDPYTNNEATNRLRTLRSLRAKKASDTEQLLEEMITKEDFKGMGAFLRPLRHSSDAFKKQTYEQHKRRIRKVVEDRASRAHAILSMLSSAEDVRRVADTLCVLEDAYKEIGTMFDKWTELNISSEATILRDKLTARLLNLSKGVQQGCKLSDYYMMGNNQHLASIIFESAEPFLGEKAKREFKSAESKLRKTIEELPKQVECFCSSLFQESGRLEKILPSLKAASTSQDPDLPQLRKLYKETTDVLAQKMSDRLRSVCEPVVQTESYDDGIDVLEAATRAYTLWLGEHIVALPFDTATLLEEWKMKRAELESQDESYSTAAERFRSRRLQLEKLKNSNWFERTVFKTHKTYTRLQERLDKEGQAEFDAGCALLFEREWSLLRKKLEMLSIMAKELSDYNPKAKSREQQLKHCVVETFVGLCERSVKCLKAVDCREANALYNFQGIFLDLRDCVIRFPFVLHQADAKKEFCLVTQLVHGILESGIAYLEMAITENDFFKARTFVLHNRTEGGFLADHYSILKEELTQCGELQDEMWLTQISCIVARHFSNGRDLANIKSCVILGILPSARDDEVRRAYKQKAREVHPDKNPNQENHDSGEDFRRVKDAYDVLISPRSREKVDRSQPFDSIILALPGALKDSARQYLQDQAYGKIELLLERLSDFQLVGNLVTPPLAQDVVQSGIVTIVQDCVHGLKVEVDTFWNDRRYKELNQSINDLKQMESYLKSFPDVFPESWNRGIVEKVEQEIDSSGQKARSFLQNKKTATDCADDFRRCFIQMGSALVELQSFKEYTKTVMYGVLESCLKSDWGYSYLFEFGLTLHRGDELMGEDENRIAQTLLSEFPHFKEVMTMVWNEETAQKPVEDTVNDIAGEQRSPEGGASSSVAIDRDALLQSFYSFDAEYKKLLGEYLGADADHRGLAKKAIALAGSVKPLCCASGWDADMKKKLPLLLASVFALFTILKSGDSFNRIQKSADTQNIGEKLLMKPHNIQVLTLLHLLGCGKASADTSLESHLMQIRTGEGKSIILGAAAAMLGLLGFKVRCVCYSEYLSCRDYSLFKEVFHYLGLDGLVIYSKITTLSEDTTAIKGDIRSLTEGLLRQRLPQQTSPPSQLNQTIQGEAASTNGSTLLNGIEDGTTNVVSSPRTTDAVGPVTPSVAQSKGEMEEILLVDEVDVFFGPDFYGKTYNQIMELREPEIAEILSIIWTNHVQLGQKQKLANIQASVPYRRLAQKMLSFTSLIDNEIRLMLDHVHRVDDERYYLDPDQGIGYKVHDTISYKVTYGYRTVFAYMKEGQAGNLKDKIATLQKVQTMPIPCGQFSYANISPARILGVSGTLAAMGNYEKDVLRTYGVDTLFYVPSVYGQSNFVFDEAADGIFIEPSKSDYFQKISQEIQSKTQQKRAVIVFFEDTARLHEFKSSPFYSRLGRQKATLVEDMDAGDKEFVISKAATSGQVTLCPAVFGRGTNFFCKDDRVQDGGGVHIIQAFLSLEKSEEVQIQGRTSRQGKKGSFQLVLWEDDLCKNFNLPPGAKDNVPFNSRYDWLCDSRAKRNEKHWEEVDDNLKIAAARDSATHEYFDALLAGSQDEATRLFQNLYATINKPPIPEKISVDVALLLDVTGSMAPYCKPTLSTIECLISGNNSILANLKTQFPDTEVKLRLGVLGYRDIDDGNNQFCEGVWNGREHFTESPQDALTFAKQVLLQSSGGHDLAEDHLGAITRSLAWSGPADWSSPIKMVLIFTDAPAHGCVPATSSGAPNVDAYSLRHPSGLTATLVAGNLASKGVSLIFCSYNPYATALTEEKLAKEYLDHPHNSEGREIKAISMIPRSASLANTGQSMLGDVPMHIVFVLDESGSMNHSWAGVVTAFHDYVARRRQNQNELDIVSVVQFDSSARVTVDREPIHAVVSRGLDYQGGGTQFGPAAVESTQLAASTPMSHTPTVVFMSDGGANDALTAASSFTALNRQVIQKHGSDLDLHIIAFGSGADTQQLQQISKASPKGRVYLSSDTVQLTNIFVSIAGGGQQVATVLQEEIGKEISEAVSDTLCLGYLS